MLQVSSRHRYSSIRVYMHKCTNKATCSNVIKKHVQHRKCGPITKRLHNIKIIRDNYTIKDITVPRRVTAIQ